MTLQAFLNKFTNDDFLLTVDGWCDEMNFSDYEEEKEQKYWNKFKNRKIKSFAILTTNMRPELYITLQD